MRSERGGRQRIRRIASVLAAVGALLISSGIALMASPMSASAGNDHGHENLKIVVCKYVGTPGESRLQTGNNPLEVSVRTLQHLDWDGTFPFAWTDAQGQAGGGSIAIGYVGQVPSELSQCPGYEPELLQAHAVAVPVAPTCESNVASYSTEGSVGVASWDESAEPAFDSTITLTAHAADGYTFDGSATTTVDVTFGSAATGCETPMAAEAVAVPVSPTCESNVASYSTDGSVGVASWDESAEPAFDSTITLTAHAADGYSFDGSATTTVEVTFGAAATGCETVEPPVVEPPTEEPTTTEPTTAEPTTEVAGPTTPTVVHAGLAGEASGPGARDEGVVLVLAGLLLLAGAGLGLVRGGERPTS